MDHTALEKALEDVIQRQTFSLEAVEAIKAMREDNAELYENLEKERKNHLETIRDKDKALASYTIADKECQDWRAKEKCLTERETKHTELRMDAKRHEEVRDAYKDCFHTVFKNVVFREETQKHLALEGGGSGGANYGGVAQSVTDTKTTTKE